MRAAPFSSSRRHRPPEMSLCQAKIEMSGFRVQPQAVSVVVSLLRTVSSLPDPWPEGEWEWMTTTSRTARLFSKRLIGL